jgi:hypothetical protein
MRDERNITFGQMRQSGLRHLHVFCGDDQCAYSVAMDPDCWPASLRLADLEALFVCSACGHRGAKIRQELALTRQPQAGENAS